MAGSFDSAINALITTIIYAGTAVYRFVTFKSLKYPIVPISTHNAIDPVVVDPFIFSTTKAEYFASLMYK